MLDHFHQRIAEKAASYAAPPVVIVAFGDSVTQGCTELSRFDFDRVYHAQLKRLLEQRWPQTTFSVINAGCAGQCAHQALAERMDRDVIRYQPDLLLVAFGLNDAYKMGREKIDTFAEAIEQIVHRARTETPADVVLLTPPMMIAHDNPAVHPQHRGLVEPMMNVQNSGVLRDFADRVRQVGQRMRVPVADVHAAWRSMADRGIDTTAFLANGLNHPNAEMHRMAARILFETLAREAELARGEESRPR